MPHSPIEDRLAIAELVSVSCVAVMRKDVAAWRGTWAQDALWKIDMLDVPARGRDAIMAIFERIIRKFTFVSMSALATETVVEGDRASGKAYSQELLFPVEGGQKILVGCFHDDYVRRDGKWFFQSRVYETLYRSTIIAPQA